MEPLLPCPGCQRHVRCRDTRCPFCGVGLSLVAPCLIPASERIGRAAYFAFRTLVAGTTVGCGAATGLEGVGPGGDAGATVPAPDGGGPDAGALPPTLDAGPVDAGWDGGPDAGADAGQGGSLLYGGPPMLDAGMDAGGVVDLYGAPPMPAEDAGPADAGGTEALYGGPSPGP